MSQSNFKAPKDIRLNATQYFIMKIINKRELQQIALTHPSDMEFYNLMKLYKDYPGIIKSTLSSYHFDVED